MRTRISLVILVSVAMACLPAAGQPTYQFSQDGTTVPDVNKPNPADNSCWLAAAANTLAASGWGTAGDAPGAAAQSRATSIYNQMMAHFGNGVFPGKDYIAINWWLLSHGLNAKSADFDPTMSSYTDVTRIAGSISATTYDQLLNELAGPPNQYINVSWEIPGAEVGHCMTLVGGHPSASPPPNDFSIHHDSNGDNPDIHMIVGDDLFINDFTTTGFWRIDYAGTPMSPGDDWEATGATILCPGLQKPVSAMENFDVAWFTDKDANGEFNRFRHAGEMHGTYTAPDPEGILPEVYGSYWVEPSEGDPTELVIPNQEVQDMEKHIWLLIDYFDRGRSGDPGIRVFLPDGTTELPDSIVWDNDGGQVLINWVLETQPDYETIVFPDTNYFNLTGNVKDFNVATECVPEPAMLSLLAAGGLAILRRRR